MNACVMCVSGPTVARAFRRMAVPLAAYLRRHARVATGQWRGAGGRCVRRSCADRSRHPPGPDRARISRRRSRRMRFPA